MPTWPNLFTSNVYYIENKSSLWIECSLCRIRHNEHKKSSLCRKFFPIKSNTHNAENILFRRNGIRCTVNLWKFFGLISIRYNAYYDQSFMEFDVMDLREGAEKSYRSNKWGWKELHVARWGSKSLPIEELKFWCILRFPTCFHAKKVYEDVKGYVRMYGLREDTSFSGKTKNEKCCAKNV